MNSLRVFFLGGLISYRALFNWLTPWILIPTFFVQPLFQVLFFVFLGRTAGVDNASFFLIGNAVECTAFPCLFAMSRTIAGERTAQTLSLLLGSPARRLPLFAGRAAPVIINGIVVSILVLAAGALIVGVRLPLGSLLPLVAVMAIASFACTGLGLMTAAVALRVRDTSVLPNIIFGILLIFCGVNVPLRALPRWMAATADWLPLTHGIAAARALAGGRTWHDVADLAGREAALGVGYFVAGIILLRYFEAESRHRATLDTA
jgi:ABC-2 type transport system permease protein